MNYDALLFDCDGVLVDSEAITNGVLCTMLNEAGWVLAPDECMRLFIGKTVRSEAARIQAHTGKPLILQLTREFDDFYSEPRGKRTGTRSSVIDYVSRHGDVVDALHAWLTDRGTPSGTRLVKSPLIDLGLARRKELLAVYEVKTGTTRSDLYGRCPDPCHTIGSRFRPR